MRRRHKQGSWLSKCEYAEDADDSRSEQNDGTQYSPSLESWSPADDGNNLYNQDAYPNGQSTASQYPSRKANRIPNMGEI